MNILDNFQRITTHNTYDIHWQINLGLDFIIATIIIFAIISITTLIIYYLKVSAEFQKQDNSSDKVGFTK